MDNCQQQVPIHAKYALNIEEASLYFQIGQGKIRKIVRDNPEADFFLKNGNRKLIKREKFAAYLDNRQEI